MKCPICGFDIPSGMKFCGQCGAQLGIACLSCNFVNPLDHRFCGMCGSRLSDALAPTPSLQLQFPLEPVGINHTISPLEGERRIATVILADVRSSTDLMEQLGTEAWVQLMNRVLQLLADEVYRFGGRVDQFRGDGLVAFFGATDAHEDDPERAVLAALAMHEAIRSCADELRRNRDIDLKVRVGVNTGEVIVGSVGEAGRHREDTAMGEGVALAARMETAAEPGTVLVSAHTHHLVEPRFEWQPLGEIAVKGVSRPIAVYRPLRIRTLTHAEQAPDLALPLVEGRNAAFATLKGCVEALRGGRGGIALVIGEKGMGKSLLVSRLQQYFSQITGICADEASPEKTGTAGPAVTWLHCHCRSYDQSTPYAMWRELLRSWLEAAITESDPDWVVVLHRQTDLLWGDRAEHFRPYLATLLSLPVENASAERIAYLKAEGLQKQLSQTIHGWVEALAHRRPLTLSLSDLQFADASSLDLLKTCLPISESAPVLWLASFRPDRSSPVWELRHRVETEYPHRLTMIDLPPLSAAESRAVIDQMIGHGALADEAAAFIIEKAEGNPYYLREIVYALIDQGMLRRDASGTWRQTQPIQSFDLPGSLRGLLLARIDRLSADERQVLQIAAVIGPLFWHNVLEGVAGDAGQVKLCLTNLQRAQLVHEQRLLADLGMEFTFTPSLVRDVVYDGLLSAQRGAYHCQVAEQIEAILSPESRKPYHGLLTYHYHRAGDLNKELYHALGAAEEARKVYANADALGHYTRTLALLDEIEGQSTDLDQFRSIRELRFEALDGRRQVQYPMGNIEAGHADARALLPLVRHMTDDPIFMIDALLAQPEVNDPKTHEELEAGLKMVQEALTFTRQTGDKRREMLGLLAAGNLQHLLKNPAWQELGDQALELSRQLGDLRMEVGLLLGIGDAYGMDDLQRSTEYLQAALAISQHLEDKKTETSLLVALSPQFERRGDYYRQLTEYERKRVELYREIGNRMGEGHALMFCGQIEAIYLGDYRSGLAIMQEALNRWSDATDRLFPLLRIAQIWTALGQFEAAWSTLERARAVIGRVILDIGRAGLSLVEAILHNAQGGPEHWRRVLELQAQVKQMVAEDQLSRQYQMAAACEAAAAHLGLAGCLADDTQQDEHRRLALEASQTALDIYQQFGFTQVVECLGEEILYRHSLALAVNRKHRKAHEFLCRAHDEMMRKHDLIPADSPYRKTFLENIALHRQIRVAYAGRTQSEQVVIRSGE